MRLLISAVVGIVAALGTAFALAGSETSLSDTSIAASAPIVVIVMENHERAAIVGSSQAPYLNSFRAGGRDFTQYNAVAHPSLPNYLAMVSGSTKGKTGTDSIQAGEITGANLWKQLTKHVITWNVYMESMPSVCYAGGSSGTYALKHNPATPFANIYGHPACQNVVPFTQFSASTLPAFSFVVPNLCNDMHDCSITTGDNWLAAHVPAMLSAGAEVVITFDEGSTSTGGGGNVYTVVDGPGIAGSVDTASYTHYGLLAALELRAGARRLGSAATATPLPI